MRRRERFVRAIFALPLLAACSGDDPGAEKPNGPQPGSLGAPCIEEDEWNAEFSGFAVGEVNIAELSMRCESRTCIANYFQGRVSCPYGQTEEQAMSDPQCFVPESDTPITVPVEPQRLDRRAALTVTCGCRCAGSVGPFCACSAGTVCEDLFSQTGLPPRPDAAKYCIPEGGLYDVSAVELPYEYCDRARGNCGDSRPYPPP